MPHPRSVDVIGDPPLAGGGAADRLVPFDEMSQESDRLERVEHGGGVPSQLETTTSIWTEAPKGISETPTVVFAGGSPWKNPAQTLSTASASDMSLTWMFILTTSSMT